MRFRFVVIGVIATIVLLALLLLLPLFIINSAGIDVKDFHLSSFVVTRYVDAKIVEPIRVSIPCADIPTIRTSIGYRYVEILPGLKIRVPTVDIKVTSTSGSKCEVEIPGATVKIPKTANMSIILRMVNEAPFRLHLDKAEVDVYINGRYVGRSSVSGIIVKSGVNLIEVPVVVDLEEVVKAMTPTMIKYAIQTVTMQTPTISINILIKISTQLRPETILGIPAPYAIERVCDMEKNIEITIPI